MGFSEQQNVIEHRESSIKYQLEAVNILISDKRPETSNQLKILLKEVRFFANLVGGFGILGGHGAFFKAFKYNVF